jgi:hypothetical protein
MHGSGGRLIGVRLCILPPFIGAYPQPACEIDAPAALRLATVRD